MLRCISGLTHSIVSSSVMLVVSHKLVDHVFLLVAGAFIVQCGVVLRVSTAVGLLHSWASSGRLSFLNCSCKVDPVERYDIVDFSDIYSHRVVLYSENAIRTVFLWIQISKQWAFDSHDFREAFSACAQILSIGCTTFNFACSGLNFANSSGVRVLL